VYKVIFPVNVSVAALICGKDSILKSDGEGAAGRFFTSAAINCSVRARANSVEMIMASGHTPATKPVLL